MQFVAGNERDIGGNDNRRVIALLLAPRGRHLDRGRLALVARILNDEETEFLGDRLRLRIARNQSHVDSIQ